MQDDRTSHNDLIGSDSTLWRKVGVTEDKPGRTVTVTVSQGVAAVDPEMLVFMEVVGAADRALGESGAMTCLTPSQALRVASMLIEAAGIARGDIEGPEVAQVDALIGRLEGGQR